MINFFGYHFRKFDFFLAIFDVLICSLGFFFYASLGLASSNSTTPQLISPILLSLCTGIILWGLLFAVGINTVPTIGKKSLFFLKAIVVFCLSLPIIVPLWWVAGFEYDKTPLLTIPALFFQICILIFIRLIVYKFTKDDADKTNLLIIATKQETLQIKNIIKQSASHYSIKRILNISLLHRYPRFNPVKYCQKNDITKVIIGNLRSREDIIPLINLGYESIQLISLDLFQEQEIGKISIERLYNYTSLIKGDFRPSQLNFILKRAFDIIFSVFLLFLSSPLFILTALLIKLEDGGSVFYHQRRVGLKEKHFDILKFRSMKENAEQNGVQWASQNDNRITKIGRFIRKTRIDELPQLINILKNDMSIVGPRPERPEFVQQLNATIPYYNERHRIKPGLTGWAQINAGYTDSIEGSKEKLQFDLYYLKYFNPSLDLLIVLRTVSVVLWPEKVH